MAAPWRAHASACLRPARPLQAEERRLRATQRAHRAQVETPTADMYQECMELLTVGAGVQLSAGGGRGAVRECALAAVAHAGGALPACRAATLLIPATCSPSPCSPRPTRCLACPTSSRPRRPRRSAPGWTLRAWWTAWSPTTMTSSSLGRAACTGGVGCAAGWQAGGGPPGGVLLHAQSTALMMACAFPRRPHSHLPAPHPHPHERFFEQAHLRGQKVRGGVPVRRPGGGAGHGAAPAGAPGAAAGRRLLRRGGGWVFWGWFISGLVWWWWC